MSKLITVGRRSKTVAFVAILAFATFGAFATASAQPTNIKALDKSFQDHYARGNYPAAQMKGEELERLAKARFGADHPDLPAPPCVQASRHALEFGRLHDRQIGGLLTFESPRHVCRDLPKRFGKTRSVAHQAAGLCKLTHISGC